MSPFRMRSGGQGERASGCRADGRLLLLCGAVALSAACFPPGDGADRDPAGWSDARIDSLRSAMPGLMRAHRVPGVAVALMLAAGTGGAAPSAWTRLARPRATVREELGLSWGAGWALERDRHGSVAAFHWGSNPGFKSFALVDRDREMGLVILTNGDNGLELVKKMVEIIDDKTHPVFGFYMLHPDD